jgi:hypothetical protein
MKQDESGFLEEVYPNVSQWARGKSFPRYKDTHLKRAPVVVILGQRLFQTSDRLFMYHLSYHSLSLFFWRKGEIAQI